MPSLPKLPPELLENVLLFLSDPRDLLCAALTSKTFYNMIIPTYHLHFASISCSVSFTPPPFWQKLSTMQYVCSMVRRFELSNDNVFSNSYHRMRRVSTFRVDEEFVKRWTESSGDWQRFPPHSNFQDLLRCLENFDRCQSIAIFEDFLQEEGADLLACISDNLSDRLKSLVITSHFGNNAQSYIPRYTLSKCSFSHLITFHIEVRLDDVYLYASIESMLDSLISTCSTLVNFTLSLTYWTTDYFSYFALMKHAHWPLLKRLRLEGHLVLFNPGVEPATGTVTDIDKDTYISFLERHPRLEALELQVLAEDDDGFSSYGTQFPLHILPHLRALNTNFSVHPHILPRLLHIGDLRTLTPDIYPLARSLRSCILPSLDAKDTIKLVTKAIHHLQFFCIFFDGCIIAGCTRDICVCLLEYGFDHIAMMHDLTHLGLILEYINQNALDSLLKRLVNHLPKLACIYLYNDERLPQRYQVIRNPDNDGSFELNPSGLPFHSDWTRRDFFEEMIASNYQIPSHDLSY